MRKVCICGHFGFGKTLLNGQTVKTKIVAEELEAQIGADNVMKIDTHGGIKSSIRAVFQAALSMFTSDNLIILPAHNGVRIFAPVLAAVRMISRCKLHYAVIGGWLPQLVREKPLLKKCLKMFDVIYVETSTMQKALAEQGFRNLAVMPNCKKLDIMREADLVWDPPIPYALCTFSRVMEEKGIEDAANAVININSQKGENVCTLDIFGPVDPAYEERFHRLQEEWPEYIRYMGCVDYDKSVEVLKNYFLLLFPTRFFTEGIPGSIIDAYAAGVPVLSAKWESYMDIVDETTGFVFDFEDQNSFVQKLQELVGNPQMVIEKKPACLKKAEAYLPCNVIQCMIGRLNGV